MKDNLTEIVFIIDRSGSMSGLEKDTVGGYNEFLQKQKKVEGQAIITTVLFDDKFQILHNRVNIKDVKLITEKEYFVRGSTALYDAIGNSIDNIGFVLNDTEEEEKPSKVIFVIITDGMENASREYSQRVIKKKIKHQKEKYNWEFMFLGCNFDAESFAESISIERGRSAQFDNSKEGILANYSAMDYAINKMRSSEKCCLSDDVWKQKIKRQDNK